MILFLFVACFVSSTFSLTVDNYLSDNAVLQRSFFMNEQLMIHGTAGKGSAVMLKLSSAFETVKVETATNDKGEYRFVLDVPNKVQIGSISMEISSEEEVLSFSSLVFGDVFECFDDTTLQTKMPDLSVIDEILIQFVYYFSGSKWYPVTLDDIQVLSPLCLLAALNVIKLSESSQDVFLGIVDHKLMSKETSLMFSRYLSRAAVFIPSPGVEVASEVTKKISFVRSQKQVGDFPAVVVSPFVSHRWNNSLGEMRNSLYDITEENVAIVETYDLDSLTGHLGEVSKRIGLRIIRLSLPYHEAIQFSLGPMVLFITGDKSQRITLSFNVDSAKGFEIYRKDPALPCNFFQIQYLGEENWKILDDELEVQYNLPASIVLVPLSGKSRPITKVRFNWDDKPNCFFRNIFGLVSKTFEKPVIRPHNEILPSRKPQDMKRMTPVMGFNPWNFYHCNIDQNEIEKTAELLVSLGLYDIGYNYINLDDCWQRARSPRTNKIVEDYLRFPHGLRPLISKLHNMGFKVGLYTSSSSLTCQLRPGSYRYEDIDAKTYCQDYEIDFIKVDNCFGSQYEDVFTSWEAFKEGIDKYCKDSFIVSVEYCSSPIGCGLNISNFANMWRTTIDSSPSWASLYHNIHENNRMSEVANPGHFNDPDMLEIGNRGLTYFEEVTQFSLWCIVSAPLILGTDLAALSPQSLTIVKNREAIAINQDLGYKNKPQGILHSTLCASAITNESLRRRRSLADCKNVEVWLKVLASKHIAIAFVNVDVVDVYLSVDIRSYAVSHFNRIRDIWDESTFSSSLIDTTLRSHETKFYATQLISS